MLNGSNQITGSHLGFGCAYLAKEISYSSTNKLIGTAIDKGIRHFDVAPSYGRGTAEHTLGKALKNHRNEVTIATKVGIAKIVDSDLKLITRSLLSPVRSFLRSKKRSLPTNTSKSKTNFEVNFVENSIQESLFNLGTDYLDILFLHMVRLEDINDDLLIYLEKIKSSGVANKIGIATTKEYSIEINNKFPKFFDVNQIAWNLDDGIINKDEYFTITHGIIANTFNKLRLSQEKNPDHYKLLSAQLDVDLFDKEVLSSLLIGVGVIMNPDGAVLLATRNKERLKTNIEAALDTKNLNLASKFFDLIN